MLLRPAPLAVALFLHYLMGVDRHSIHACICIRCFPDDARAVVCAVCNRGRSVEQADDSIDSVKAKTADDMQTSRIALWKEIGMLRKKIMGYRKRLVDLKGQMMSRDNYLDTRMDNFKNAIGRAKVAMERRMNDMHIKMAVISSQSGPQGAPGPDGYPGKPGVQGYPGERGDRGAPGLIGVTGPRGFDGRDGIPGGIGPKGDMGLPGARGPQGPSGIPGRRGPMGLYGIAGAGHQGSRGPPGPSGPPGYSGVAGPSGGFGQSIPGQRGLPGTSGPAGSAGPPGPPGAAGSGGNPGSH